MTKHGRLLIDTGHRRPIGEKCTNPNPPKPSGPVGHASHAAAPKAWCYPCGREHRWEECPMTPEERREAGARRMARDVR